MFVLRTGLQGHSKTLNTIKELDKRSVETGRPIYYHNIRDLQVDKLKGTWVPFEDPRKWYELPENAIAVIDEAQRFFGVRGQSQAVPRYASELETMRHNGHELHCITQDPGLLDHHMRKLCNSHIHYNRPNKGKLVSRWEFERPINPSNKSEYASGQCTITKLDSNFFGVYSSSKAEHHFKWQPPRALFILIGCVLLLGLAAWKLSGRFHGPDPVPAQTASSAPSQQQSASPAGMQSEHVTVDQYLKLNTPRIPDVASSAPIYDEITRPQSFPRPFCVASTDQALLVRNQRRMAVEVYDGRLTGCRCNSQQGTRMSVSFEYCMNVVDNGYFDNTRPSETLGQRQVQSKELGGLQERGGLSDRPDDAQRQAITVIGIPETRIPRTLL